MRRLLPFLAAAVLATGALTGVGVASAARGSACVTAAGATYEHRFDAAGGTLTVTSARPLCDGEEQLFSLSSSTTSGGRQFVHDTAGAWISSDRGSITLSVTVPACRTLVEAARGADPLDRGSSGTDECVPRPSLTFDSWCDGVLHTRLANAPGASIDAVFLIGGRRLRVAPGEHADLTSRPSGPVEVRTNAFTTSTGVWTPPADCTPAL